MKFSRWLNSLSSLDGIVILFVFIVSGFLAKLTLHQVNKWYSKQQKDNRFAVKMRITPFVFFAVTIPFTIVLYNLFGEFLNSWIGKFF
ncbi:MAG TPA: hypothetical protein EYN82_04725 [Candidatus Marinimicrobia bacterium]|nr:hypothetical protein [Candidatus Neomarinimicrobiota bacterium]